jgi:hypothetical protein
MKMLSGLDGVFLHLETPTMPMHVGSVSLLEPPARKRGSFVQDVRRLYERRLPLAPVLRRKLHEFPLGMANPVWVQATSSCPRPARSPSSKPASVSCTRCRSIAPGRSGRAG